MNQQETIDSVSEEFEKGRPYDHIELHSDLPYDLRDAFYGAYAIQSVALVLLGDSCESGEGKESARPLSGYSREGLLFAVELLAEKISNSLGGVERYLAGPKQRSGA